MIGWIGDGCRVLSGHTERLGLVEGQHLAEGDSVVLGKHLHLPTVLLVGSAPNQLDREGLDISYREFSNLKKKNKCKRRNKYFLEQTISSSIYPLIFFW